MTEAITIAMEGQMQETGSQRLMIPHKLELEMKRNQLENLGVLKSISGILKIRKAKVDTHHSGKDRSTNTTILKMITRQRVDEKLQLED